MTTPISITRHQGLEAIELHAPDGACATLLLHGAHLVSWRPAGADEQLYLSPKSAFTTGQAVRGGVPVIFPQFATRGPLQRHGFARGKPWQLVSAESGKDDSLAVLRLTDDAATRMVWPHAFEAEISIRIAGRALEMELACENRGEAPLSFTAALHTYLRLTSYMSASLQGLSGLAYWDSTIERAGTQHEDLLRLDGETDRIYQDVKHDLTLRDGDRRLAIWQQGFSDAVIWNPGEEKGDALVDMPAGGWKEMLCVEAAQALRPIELQPGETWAGLQTIVLL
ncbi:MAG: D-hexose-6-phosphate mutarotase [Mitsuaria chitosanitabida]|uniref:D-hexose-6-phosphate mutarotase n=1 Tax=Roseateles chitosanitabidus TaxID=65048 RepID=UPI001B2142F4|nr:D-hexose-6-phosphate mutarotase [Roseateles chitosanitabidus]MBO9687687.1 D-hexose-6-phosphate mutarotase [Roseateles chitosanitabidus]